MKLIDRIFRRVYDRGRAAGYEQGHIDNTVWLRCPAEGCDKVIQIPLMLIIAGEDQPAENQSMHAELDSTELWLHMHSHTGKISHDD